MPIDMSAFATPKFIKYKISYPFSENRKDKFYATTGDNHLRRYRDGSFPQNGYNPNANVAEPKKVNINNDDYTLPPY